MLKRIFLIFIALLFAFGILATSVLKTTQKTCAVTFEVAGEEATPSSEEETATEAAKAKVDYYLPYPGILPDHPLYPLKMLRDRIWLLLMTDPLKKGETLLLFADKRLGAGQVLVEGNKVELGLTTISKGEKYLQEAAEVALAAKKAGRDVKPLLEKVAKAAQKHQEVIEGLSGKFTGEAKSALEGNLRYSKESLEKVNQALSF